MTTPSPYRWLRPTPGRLLVVLLAVGGCLWLANWFRWLPKGYGVLIAIAAVGAFFLLMLGWYLLALLFTWRFQYSLLSLLGLMVAVALAFAWLATEMKAAAKQQDVVAEIKKLGGGVGYDYQCGPGGTAPKPPEPAWLRRLLGDDLLVNVVEVGLANSEISDADLERLKGLPQLQPLWLNGRKVTDAGLKHLEGLSKLQDLDLNGSKVTDAGLERLKGLTQLRVLGLGYTKVSDVGLEYLKGLTHLEHLDLNDTKVSSAGLENLKEMTRLQRLYLSNTKVSDAGLEHFKGLTQLVWLVLENTNVSDAGLEHLKGLTGLRWLRLNHTKVTGEGVKKLLRALPNCNISYLDELEYLRLTGTNVTDDGSEKLRKAPPKCRIEKNRLLPPEPPYPIDNLRITASRPSAPSPHHRDPMGLLTRRAICGSGWTPPRPAGENWPAEDGHGLTGPRTVRSFSRHRIKGGSRTRPMTRTASVWPVSR
jgi:hypothetical protein